MYQNEVPTCSTQIDVDLEGEYCTLKNEYTPSGIRTENTQTTPQATHAARRSEPKNNNTKMSPKRKVSRSKSSPEHLARSPENNLSQKQKQPAQVNGFQQHASGPFVVAPGRRSTGHVKAGGRRSTGSLSGREPPPPLRYFAYLGRLTPSRSAKNPQRSRGRLPSAHDILADRPVILTSTSIVSPFATNVICQEMEELERQERQAEYNDLLDCCTCMCCVKALFYHCTHDYKDEGRVAEHPCSCKGPVRECVGRWGIMGFISIFLPCLLCYLPFEVCFRCHDFAARKENIEGSQSSGLADVYHPIVITDEPTTTSVNSARYEEEI